MNLFPLTPTAALVMQLLDSKVSTEPMFESNTFKPEYDFKINSVGLDRCMPEEEGIQSDLVIEFLDKLKNDRSLNMHSVTVARHGRILCQASFGAQRTDIWKHAFSACKSVTSIAIGILIDDGVLKLDERVVDIFRDKVGAVSKIKLKDLIVEDLLTMRSSVLFSEADAMTDADWVKAFLQAPTKGTVGKTFRYNSLNTYMLSAIVTQKTGKLLSEFLDERLFSPLGIKDYYWEKCPRGIDKGGWGLYIRPEDFVKIGTLLLNGGVYGNMRIVSEEYVSLATTKHVEIERESKRFDYGYQIWIGKDTNTFLFNGMLGQNVLCFKDSGIVIVSNAGNAEMFQQGAFFEYAASCFGREFSESVPKNKVAYNRLLKKSKELTHLSGDKPCRWWHKVLSFFGIEKRESRLFSTLVGKSFIPSEGDTQAVGILPLILQATENCFSKGFACIAFELDEQDIPTLVYKETDVEIKIPVGFDIPITKNIKYRNENFIISSKARFTFNEDGICVLVIRLDFAETPSSRIIKIFFYGDDDLVIEQSETPGEAFLLELSDMVISEYADKPVVGAFLEKFGVEFIEYKVKRIFNSVLQLKPE